MKITEYPSAETLNDKNVFLIDGEQGTQKVAAKTAIMALMGMLTPKELVGAIDLSQLESTDDAGVTSDDTILVGSADENKAMPLSDAIFDLVDCAISDCGYYQTNVNLKRSIWRGKNLGTEVSDSQYAAISDRKFKDLFLGDYWDINGVIWRIVDFEYWMNSGDTACRAPHILIMPDRNLLTAKMNETNTTEGAYYNSKMKKETLPTLVKPIVQSAFDPNHILRHREYLTTATNNGYPSAGSWFDSDIELANEIMMYGCHVFAQAVHQGVVPNKYTIDKTQLAGMRMNPWLINPAREWFWLRDVVSSTDFAGVLGIGNADCRDASAVVGVRPVFGITA